MTSVVTSVVRSLAVVAGANVTVLAGANVAVQR